MAPPESPGVLAKETLQDEKNGPENRPVKEKERYEIFAGQAACEAVCP